jgi:protocatechuate 3,4-dioxygenase beta subunit
MTKPRYTRRQALENCIAKGLLIGGAAMSQSQLFAAYQAGEAAAQKPTPKEVLGPFYKKGAPNNTTMRAPGAPGFPLEISGRVMNTKGQILHEAKVDIWHADHVGHYDTAGYTYRTKISPDAKGNYKVDTILPGHYDDRPAQHVHYLISAPGHKPLITQAYFATDPFFEGDPDKNFKKRGIVGNRELVLPVRLYEAPGTPRVSITFDLILEKA